MELAPRAVEPLLGLLLPKEQKAELAEHFARLRDHSDGFQYLADTYEIDLGSSSRFPRHRGCVLEALAARGLELQPA